MLLACMWACSWTPGFCKCFNPFKPMGKFGGYVPLQSFLIIFQMGWGHMGVRKEENNGYAKSVWAWPSLGFAKWALASIYILTISILFWAGPIGRAQPIKNETKMEGLNH